MSDIISFNSFTGKTLRFRVMRVVDGLFWDNSFSLFTTESSNSDITASESSGNYTATFPLTAVDGDLYKVFVREGTQVLMSNEVSFHSSRKTALELINKVQEKLRLPQMPISDSHSQLILTWINSIISQMTGIGTFDELKVRGAFDTVIGQTIYPLELVNKRGVEVIDDLTIGTSIPFDALNDEQFREQIRFNTNSTAQPVKYRYYSRNGNKLFIELTPTPDAVYSIDFDVQVKETKLINATDTPDLNSDVILLGATYLAKEDQKVSFQTERDEYFAHLTSDVKTFTESNTQDMRAV